MRKTLLASGFPCSNGVFVFEFESEFLAREAIATELKTVLTILENWRCNQVSIRFPQSEPVNIPIATVRASLGITQ